MQVILLSILLVLTPLKVVGEAIIAKIAFSYMLPILAASSPQSSRSSWTMHSESTQPYFGPSVKVMQVITWNVLKRRSNEMLGMSS